MKCSGCGEEIDHLTRVTVSDIVPSGESNLRFIVNQTKLSDLIVHSCGAKYRATANQSGALLFPIEEEETVAVS